MTLWTRRAALGLAATLTAGIVTPVRATTIVATPAALSDTLALRWYDVFDDRDGGQNHVLGEYRNTGAKAIAAPVLSLALLDGDGAVLETDELFPASARLAPGQTGGFSGDIHLTRGTWQRERLIVCRTVLVGPSDATADLTLHDIRELAKTDAQLRVVGKIDNTGSVPLPGIGVRAIITRAKDGRFAGVGAATLEGPLPANSTAAFVLTAVEADMPGLGAGDAYRYRLEIRLEHPLVSAAVRAG